jgi:hypothetical protein
MDLDRDYESASVLSNLEIPLPATIETTSDYCSLGSLQDYSLQQSTVS